MSELKTDVDLNVLARTPATPLAQKKRRVWPRLLPLLLLLGFAAVLVSTLTDLGRGVVRVTVVRPQSAGAEAQRAGGAAGSGELQRSGWVEPDPYPVQVSALVPGVVRELLVLEGDAVAAEQPIAQLVDAEAKLKVATAQAARARAQAEATRAVVEQTQAQRQFDTALAVKETLAIAEAEQTGRVAEQEQRQLAAVEGGAKVRIAEEELEVARYLASQGAAGPRQVELAQAALEAERAALAMLEAEVALAKAEEQKAIARLERARREQELRLDDRARVETAGAMVAVATAAASEAEAALAEAELALARTTVRAPVAGIVLQRLATPGAMVGVESREAVATLYDPARLRVRVDVEQSEVGKLAVGQRAQIRAPTRSDRPYDGEITRIVRQANVEKVTLQVHVRVIEPDVALRPEMLVETRFLANAPVADPAEAPEGAARNPATSIEAATLNAGAVWIPARLLVGRDGKQGAGLDGRDAAAHVWLIDALSGHATLRAVEVARRDGDRALVLRGVNASDKLIDGGRDQLREGTRVELADGAAAPPNPGDSTNATEGR